MRRPLFVLAVALLVLFALNSLAWADAEPTRDEIRAKCQQIDEEIQKLQQFREELMGMLGERVPAAPEPEKKTSWSDFIKFNGYFHNRFESYSDGADQFLLRRFYLNLIATPTDNTQAVITWSRIGAGSTNVDWANVFADYLPTPETRIRFGQAPNWFGLECGQSSAARIALERATMVEGGSADRPAAMRRPAGVYFAGPWDRGLWVIHTPQDCSQIPQVIVGLINGQFREREKDNNKTVTVDLKWKPRWGEFGVSWLDGQWSNDLVAADDPKYLQVTDRNALLGYVRWDPAGPFAVQGEALKGKLMGANIEGWYGQLEYALPDSPGTFYGKYELYDPNTAADSVGDMYTAWIAGYAHQFDRNNRLTLEWHNGELGGKLKRVLGVQWQYAF